MKTFSIYNDWGQRMTDLEIEIEFEAELVSHTPSNRLQATLAGFRDHTDYSDEYRGQNLDAYRRGRNSRHELNLIMRGEYDG